MGSTTAMPKMRHIAVRCRVTITVPMGFNMETDKALDDPSIIAAATAEILDILQSEMPDQTDASFLIRWDHASIGELANVTIDDSGEP